MSGVEWRDKEFLSKLDREVSAKAKRTASEYQRIIQEEFREPKHGRVYRRRTVSHTASAPGEPPAIDHRTLSQHVKTLVKRISVAAYEIIGGVSLKSEEYPAVLEFGTRKNPGSARPAWRPALEKLKSRMAGIWFRGEE